MSRGAWRDGDLIVDPTPEDVADAHRPIPAVEKASAGDLVERAERVALMLAALHRGPTARG